MDSDQVVDASGEHLRQQVFVVALVRIEGVYGSPAEYRQLIQKLQRNDRKHIRHHYFPETT